MNLNALYAYRTADQLLDLSVLPRRRLQQISDEAAAAGDLEVVAVIDTLLAGEQPTYIAPDVVEAIHRRLGGEATIEDALAMIDLLQDHGHLVDGWLVITDQQWDDLASEIPFREDEA